MTANRRIFLNIIASYGRSLYALAIGLFTARWALEVLGQVDYGIYGVVGGLTVFITYLNGILGGAIGRFYAVAVGEQHKDAMQGLESCRKWFTTAVILNATVPIILISVGYPMGAWVVEHFLTMPPERIGASLWVWRFVCLSCFLGMVTIPLQAMYIAKQYIAELTIYSFITTTLNAFFLYYMVTHPGDWLIRYAFWMCVLSFLPQLIVAVRAYFIFPECRFVPRYIRCFREIKEICSFSLWNAWGSLGVILREQGDAILLNKYFGPSVNAGFAVGAQVSAQTNTLSGSLIGAFSPAIMNAWGAGEFDCARRLSYQTCKLGTLFILVFAIPLMLEIDEVLALWLKTPPPYAAAFCIFVLAMNIVDKLAVGHMICVNANGKVAFYQALLGSIQVSTVFIAWLLLVVGCDATGVGWAMVLTTIGAVLGRVLLARTLVGLSAFYWLKRIVIPTAVLSIVSFLIGGIPRLLLGASFWRILLTTSIVEFVLVPLAWFIVLDRDERDFLVSRVIRKGCCK